MCTCDNRLVLSLLVECFCLHSGSVGIVKDATDTTVRVELHSSVKTISVDINRVALVR